MTATPDDDRTRAKQEADRALKQAQSFVARGKLIADSWRQSRKANNFRNVLRMLAQSQNPGG